MTSSCAWRLLGLLLAARFYKPCLLVPSEFSPFLPFQKAIGTAEGGSQCDSSMGAKLLSAIHLLAHSCLVLQNPHNYLISSAIKTSACVGVVFCLDCSNTLSVFASCCFLTAAFEQALQSHCCFANFLAFHPLFLFLLYTDVYLTTH